MDISEELRIAELVHGHLAPGVVLGVRMGKLAMELLGNPPRGRKLTGIAETKVCLPDALIAVAGTTPGNMNLIINDIGKLALTIAVYSTKQGYRVALKSQAAELDPALEKFMYRKGKLTHEERDRVTEIFRNIDAEYLSVKKVEIILPPPAEKTPIEMCTSCKELQPRDYMTQDKCALCSGKGYFTALEDVNTEEVRKILG